MPRSTRPARIPFAAAAVCLALLAVTSMLAHGCAARAPGAGPTAPSAPAATPATGAPLPIDPAVTHGHLANGLTYYVRENAKPENRAQIWLVVNAGSMQEDDDQLGLAHFVEHMAFNGTRHFEKQQIIDFLESIGMAFGPDINAYTSFDQTVYMLTVPTDDDEVLDRAFLILQDWAAGVSFDEEEIDKERGVVIEEWRSGRGAGARLRDRHFPVLLHGSRYAERLTIGKPEILENAPYDAFRRFYRDWYRPDLMAVVAVGDFESRAIVERIRGSFAGLTGPDAPRPRVTYPVPDHADTLVTVATDPEATSTSATIYRKLPKRPELSAANYRRLLVERLHNRMLNFRLGELRQQADPPFLWASSSIGGFVRSKDAYTQSVGVAEGGLQRGLDALLTEVRRVELHGFTEGELQRAKKSTLRSFEQSYRERDKRRSSTLANEIVRHFLEQEFMPGIEHELELAKTLLPGITLEELNRLTLAWQGERSRVVEVSAPEKEGLTPPDASTLLGWLAAAAARTPEPYEDDVRDAPLLAEEPAPGRVVHEEHIDSVDVVRWRLSNGVEVLLKPTDFQNDQILVSGFSPGGDSLVGDAEVDSANFAATLVSVGGAGQFSSVQLAKALAGKRARAATFLAELEEGVSGDASPEDAETLFQLVYLNMMSPRRDDEAIQGWMTRARGFIENRLKNPNAVFSDRWFEVLSGGHPRVRPVSVETLDRIDVDRAFEIYRERFGDAGDFTFIIVGNFEPGRIKPLVETYLGGLPAAGRTESWRDLGIRKPEGVERFEVRRGLEPKSAVRILFHGDAEWSRETVHRIDSLAAVLRIRLREVLREDMGGTYGVGVWGSIARRPVENYSLTVSFGCAPDNVDELTAAVFAEIDRIKRDGVSRDYVDKVREAQLRDRETNLKENSFWLTILGNYARYGMDFADILRYDELVEGLTPAVVQQSARRFLDTERFVQGVLYPEDATAEGGGSR